MFPLITYFPCLLWKESGFVTLNKFRYGENNLNLKVNCDEYTFFVLCLATFKSENCLTKNYLLKNVMAGRSE
jgi:hypothetical protein